MIRMPQTYIAKDTPVHRCDARVKVVMLLLYSVTLFLVTTWHGLGLCLLLFAMVFAVSRLPLAPMLKMLIPIYVVMAFTLLFNSFALDITQQTTPYGLGDVSAGVLQGAAPIALWGTFGFLPVGFARGGFYALRIILLVLSGLVVAYATPSTDLTRAFEWFIRPLRRFGVHTDDIAMIFSIALRFIPLTVDELVQVRAAQMARGANFESGGIGARLRAWQTVFIPLFVNLYRRADILATAFDARCYGYTGTRTDLHPALMAAADWGILSIGTVLMLAICILY